MQPDKCKQQKRALKRRNRNKRRKQQQRAKNQNKSDTNSGNEQQQQNDNTVPGMQKNFTPYQMDKSNWSAWWRTYKNLIDWHSRHQMNFWRQNAIKLRNENDELKRKLCEQYDENLSSSEEDENMTRDEAGVKLSQCMTYEEHESSSEEEEIESDDEVDEGYLQFLAVTLKHRADLKAKREKEQAEADAEVAPEAAADIVGEAEAEALVELESVTEIVPELEAKLALATELKQEQVVA